MVALGSTLIDTAKFGSNDVTAFYLGSNEAWTAGEPAELIKPTSIANSGGSASIGTNGQVTFSGVTSLSLNGVFSADFDNYAIVLRGKNVSGAGNQNIGMRMRLSGTDATATNYTSQVLQANNTSISAARYSSRANGFIGSINESMEGGFTAYVYGPYLAQPTSFRGVTTYPISGTSGIADMASTHNVSTAYDGCTLVADDGNGINGAISIYGIRS